VANPAFFNSGIQTPKVEALEALLAKAIVSDLSCVISMMKYASKNVDSAANILSLDADKPFVRITGTTETSIHGIKADKSEVVFVFNATDKSIFFKNLSEDIGVSPTEKILTPSGISLELPRNSTCGWMRDPVAGVWVIQSGSGSGGGGGGFSKIVTKTASGAIAPDEDCILITPAASINLTLPEGTLKEQHNFIRTDNIEARTVTIQCTGADQILTSQGIVTSVTLPYQGDRIKLVFIATNLWGVF
jgi:hypothetical protein